MTLLEALNTAAIDRKAIVSCVGRRYEPTDLAVTWYGNHYASYADLGMTKGEREGIWKTAE